jgi:uncharacterized membrane protein
MPSRSSSTSAEKNFAEWALFLLVALCAWHGQWMVHSDNPYEFLRHGSDNLGYYQWLPAAFIDHDFDRMYWCHQLESGKWISMFTMGVAVLQLPFFLIGHFFANGMGYPVNGFSSPYGVAIMLGASIYAGAGCVLAYKLAARFVGRLPAMLASVVLFAATNLIYYSVHEPVYSHVYSFFLIGLFCWCGLRIHDGPRPVHVMLFAMSGGLMVLVRQLNFIVVLFPLMTAWSSAAGLRGFWRNLMAHRTVLLLSTVLVLVPFALQMAYWDHITGNPLTFTYGQKGEHFEFDKMVPGLVLFSVRNGWFVYTPVMIPVMVMLVVYAWRGVGPARPVLAIVTFTWLMYSAWWCWWLGTSFSHRGFVDHYALLAIPMAWILRSVLQRSWSLRLITGILLVAAIKLNFGMMERFDWLWSWHEWTWQKLFEQVSAIVTG